MLLCRAIGAGALLIAVPAAASGEDVAATPYQQIAQSDAGSPTQLAPPVQLTPPDTGGALQDSSAGFGAGRQAPEPQEDTPRSGIDIDRLGDRGFGFVGVLDETRGGYSADLWLGSNRETLAGLFARLPDKLSSPSLHAVGRKLLLTRGVPPGGRGQLEGEADVRILESRAESLFHLGAFDDLNTMMDNVPGELPSERLARTEVRSLLLSDAEAQACNKVRTGVARYETPFWTRAAVYCQLADGRVQEAELGLSLLRETGDGGGFLRLAQTIAAQGGVREAEAATAKSADQEPGEAGDLTLMLAFGGPVNMGALDVQTTAAAVALCEDESVEMDARTAACEQAVERGALPGERLRGIYRRYAFSQDFMAEAPSRAVSLSPPQGRALLFQAARGESVPTARAELLRIGLDRALADGVYLATVRAYAPLIGEIAPSPELLWFAVPAGRALYVAGRWEGATAWLLLAHQEAVMNAQAAGSFMALWPYAEISGGQTLTMGGSLAAWRSSQEEARGHENMRKLARLRAIFHGLGIADDLGWGQLAASLPSHGTSAPPAPYLYALWDARDSGRLGESLLLMLILLGGEGPAESHDLALNVALDTLMRFGLEQTARQLAIEAAVAAGI